MGVAHNRERDVMDQKQRLAAEDADPVFKVLKTYTMSRHRSREILKELDAQGYAIVKKDALPAPVETGFAAAVLAAAEKRS